MSLNRKDLSNRPVTMEHRHFKAIAAALRESRPASNWEPAKMSQWKSTVNSFVVICRSSNSRFNADRFLAACNHEDRS